MYRLAFVFVLAAFAASGCGDPATNGEVVSEAGFELITVDAASFTEEVSELDADIRIINIWATWCGPCHVEMPEFVRFGKEMEDEGVAVRFVSIDDDQFLPQVEQFLTKYKVTGPSYFSGTGDVLVREIHPQWQYGLPTTLMIDRDMKIRDVWEGAVNYDFLVAKVERLRGILAEEAASGLSTSTES